MTRNNRTVYFNRMTELWFNKADYLVEGFLSTTVHQTQKEALSQARTDIRRLGGGELSVHAQSTGRIREKNTVRA